MAIKVPKDVWNTILSHLPPDNKESYLPRYITYRVPSEHYDIQYNYSSYKDPNYILKVVLDTSNVKMFIGPRYINNRSIEYIGVIFNNSKTIIPTFTYPISDKIPEGYDAIIFKNINGKLYKRIIDHINKHDINE